jgi:hypothetical protein
MDIFQYEFEGLGTLTESWFFRQPSEADESGHEARPLPPGKR